MEAIKRQAGTVCSCLAVRLARVCGLSLQPIGCTSSLACDEQRYRSCSCRYWRYIILPFTGASGNMLAPFALHAPYTHKHWQ